LVRCGAIGLGLGFWVCSAKNAAAAPIEDRVRLGLEGSLLSYESLSLSGDVQGVSMSAKESATSFGVSTSSLGIGLGYGISDSIALDGRALFGVVNRGVDGGGSSSGSMIALHAMPSYVFGGDAVRPFLGVDVGVQHEKVSAAGGDLSSTVGVVGAMAGARCFVSDSWSLDPMVTIFGETGSQSIGSLDLGRSGFGITLGFALSGWLGDGSSARPSPSAETEPLDASRSAVANAGVMAPGAPRPAVASAGVTAPAPDAFMPEQTRSSRLVASIELDADTALEFETDLHRPKHVDVSLRTRDDANAPSRCEALVAHVADSEIRFRGVSTTPRVAGFGSIVAVTAAHTSLAHAERIADGAEVTLERCDRHWSISTEALEPLRTLIKTASVYAGSLPKDASSTR